MPPVYYKYTYIVLKINRLHAYVQISIGEFNVVEWHISTVYDYDVWGNLGAVESCLLCE